MFPRFFSERLTHLCKMNFPLLSIGPVHICFKSCWVVVFIFVQILIEHSVSKQCWPCSDAAFCDVCSGSTLFVDVP